MLIVDATYHQIHFMSTFMEFLVALFYVIMGLIAFLWRGNSNDNRLLQHFCYDMLIFFLLLSEFCYSRDFLTKLELNCKMRPSDSFFTLTHAVVSCNVLWLG